MINDTPGTKEYSRTRTAVEEVRRAGSNVARINGIKLSTLQNHVKKAKPAWNKGMFEYGVWVLSSKSN